MKEFDQDEYLMISGIQHFIYCRRQWSLIHIEKAWAENFFTTDGELKHERADDRTQKTKRNNIIEIRALPVSSSKLGIYGVCDVVELQSSPEGIYIPKYKGTYEVYPIEYKRGKPKSDESDIMQLLAQAVCLEEMLFIRISKGAIFYYETRRREEIEFTENLRNKLNDIVTEMQKYYKTNLTPKVRKGPKCKACSMKDKCLFELGDTIPVKKYIERMVNS